MALNLSMPGHEDLKPRITVFGVGGAGGNAVNNMIEKQLDGVEFVVANTDAQALKQSNAQAKIQMGVKLTEGLGAGARPSIGASAAEESIQSIVDHLAGAHMCFITAGMGGGTGTGAAPIIAQAARELGVLTVGVVTKPFQFEGAKRMRQAEDGVEALQKVVDTLIVIPNQNLFRLATENTTFSEAFALADDVLYQGVKGVTDLMVRPGIINLDFADVRAVMDEMGKAMMGTGEAEGQDRATHAAEKAIANPLLDEISLTGAKGVLINVTGGYDMTLFEFDEAANVIRAKVDPNANIIVGSTLDPEMGGRIRVSVVATGIDASERAAQDAPNVRRSMAEPLRQSVSAEPPARVASVAPSPVPSPAHVAAPVASAAPVSQVARPTVRPTIRPGAAYGFTDDNDSLYDPHAPSSASTPSSGARAAAAVAWREESFEDEAEVPPSAYRPHGYESPAEPVFDVADDTPEPVYEAPRTAAAGTPGTPTPEAMARLRAMAARAAEARSEARAADPRLDRGGDLRADPRAAAPTPQPASRAAFGGINSLIHRMTGQAPSDAGRGAAAPEASPGASPLPDPDRPDIPAFLRRQAN